MHGWKTSTSLCHTRIRRFPSCMLWCRARLYAKVFEKVSKLDPQFAASCAVADFEEASVSAFHHVFQDAGGVGCWFHYAQAVMKRCNKIGLEESYGRDVDVATIVQCLAAVHCHVFLPCVSDPAEFPAPAFSVAPTVHRTQWILCRRR